MAKELDRERDRLSSQEIANKTVCSQENEHLTAGAADARLRVTACDGHVIELLIGYFCGLVGLLSHRRFGLYLLVHLAEPHPPTI
jgi:hypothetical protein